MSRFICAFSGWYSRVDLTAGFDDQTACVPTTRRCDRSGYPLASLLYFLFKMKKEIRREAKGVARVTSLPHQMERMRFDHQTQLSNPID
jgi:hypothetical protein